MKKQKVLVVIITYNGMQWIERCLGSVLNSSIDVDAFIVDNGSTDGTQEYIKKKSRVIFVQNKKNLGFGKANNIALKYALSHEYDYVYLLNQDAWIEKDTIEKMIIIQKTHSAFGVLSPMQMNSDKTRIDKNLISLLSKCPNIINDLYNNSLKEVYPINFVMAAHWLLSYNCLKKVGGFAPIFPHYGEDLNYLDRVLFHGFQIGIIPSLKVVHNREFRLETKKHALKVLYVSFICNICNINNTLLKAFFLGWNFFYKEGLKILFKYKTMSVFFIFVKIIIKIPSMLHARGKISSPSSIKTYL